MFVGGAGLYQRFRTRQADTGTADTTTQKNMVRNVPKQWLKRQNKTLRTIELLGCAEDQIAYDAKKFVSFRKT